LFDFGQSLDLIKTVVGKRKKAPVLPLLALLGLFGYILSFILDSAI